MGNTGQLPGKKSQNQGVNIIARKKKTVPKRTAPIKEIETYPHFRKYVKSGHPALIVGEYNANEYKYRKVMHSERDGRHLNEKVYPNPNPADKEPMHIAKRVRHDEKQYFPKKYSWKYKK